MNILSISNHLIMFFTFLLTSSFATATTTLDSRFAAPTFVDRTKIVAPEVGAIVFDSTDAKFYGNTDGTTTGWTAFAPEAEPIITCWTSYTPTWSTTVNQPTLGSASLSGKWRRVGDTMELKIFFNTNGVGSFGSGDWLFELPDDGSNTYEPDANKLIVDSNSDAYVGTAQMKDADGSYYTFNSVINDPANVSKVMVKGALGGVNLSYPFTWQDNGNDTLVIKASVPISGWKTTTPTMSLNCN